jgi:hypothetical protein
MIVASRTYGHQRRVLAWIGVSTRVLYKGWKLEHDSTYEGTITFARGWGAERIRLLIVRKEGTNKSISIVELDRLVFGRFDISRRGTCTIV